MGPSAVTRVFSGFIGDQNRSNPDRTSQSDNAKILNESFRSASSWPVIFFVPNLLGYLRILLAFLGLKYALRLQPSKALNIWIAAALLDMIDGVAARRLNQCSRFGILVDIVADNILRTIVWISSMIVAAKIDAISDSTICVWAAIISLEWTTMFCSQSSQTESMEDSNIHWKDVKRKSAMNEGKKAPPPFWVQAVFRNNFRTLPGMFAIYGLFAAPFGSYVWCADWMSSKETWPSRLLPEQILSALIMMAYVGRLVSALVELWLCYNYLSGIIARDSIQKTYRKVS